MDLNLLHLIFSLTLDGAVASPFALFDLSRRFPAAFREVTCGRTTPCGECPAANGCCWFPLFGQPLSSDPEAVKRHQKPPLPLVFSIPLLAPGEVSAADAELGLTLVGSAVNHAGEFIRGMERFCSGELSGGNLAVTLDGVSCRGLFGERSAVRVTKRGDLTGDLRVLAAGDIAGKLALDEGSVTLDVLTPLRQFREGRLLRRFDCSAFLRGLIRRVSSLVAAYGENEVVTDFRWLAERSREIHADDSALVSAENTGPALAGLHGSVTLTGDLGPFLPYLFLGEYLHAGKGASWGFGRYEIRDS